MAKDLEKQTNEFWPLFGKLRKSDGCKGSQSLPV